MVRDKIISIGTKYYISKEIEKKDIQEVIKSYCEEHGKTENVDLFITLLFLSNHYYPYFNHALAYYEHKFSINKIVKTNIIDNQEVNQVILIY